MVLSIFARAAPWKIGENKIHLDLVSHSDLIIAHLDFTCAIVTLCQWLQVNKQTVGREANVLCRSQLLQVVATEVLFRRYKGPLRKVLKRLHIAPFRRSLSSRPSSSKRAERVIKYVS